MLIMSRFIIINDDVTIIVTMTEKTNYKKSESESESENSNYLHE
jgi:hypothetical protein